MHAKHIALLSTGGTIEKTYNEWDGTLTNHISVLDMMLSSLVLRGVTITRHPVMNKDSLEMDAADHAAIAEAVHAHQQHADGILITHGTDRLQYTGEEICVRCGITPRVPVILTGAMRPFELRTTDALQNLTEALLAVQIVPPGVYVAMHNQVLRFPGVVKDAQNLRFLKP